MLKQSKHGRLIKEHTREYMWGMGQVLRLFWIGNGAFKSITNGLPMGLFQTSQKARG